MRVFAITVALLLAWGSAVAQDYPQRPVKLIVPFPPGGVTDIAGRVVGQKLGEKFSQQVVVENRSGAAGIVGVEVAAHAPADGYTLLVTTGDFATINPSAYAKINYDPERDFVPIAMITNTPLLLVASAKTGITNVKEMVAAAKAKGDLAFSTPGNGSTNHLMGEQLAEALKIKLLHVPYRGGAPAAAAVAGDEVPIGIIAISTGLPHVNAGTVKVLGIASPKRMTSLADWPTLAEAGGPDMDASLWVGMWGPAGVPQPIVDRLHDEIGRILNQADVRERLATLGAQPLEMTRAAFTQHIKVERERFTKVVRQANIRIE